MIFPPDTLQQEIVLASAVHSCCVCVVVFRDLMAITAALEFNQWFSKLSIKDFKLVTECV